MGSQPRQPKGIPVGGQYATSKHDESELVLGGTGALLTRRQAAIRSEMLAAAGYVPPLPTPTGLEDPTRVQGREAWWAVHWMSAEQRAAGSGQFPQMPDDFTPNMTGGQARSGYRRTHRIRYEGAGVSLRMPSATSIRSWERQHGGTFDVPVSASYPGGDIQGWVRLTKVGDRWHASGVGFPEDADVNVSESVSAVLESRAPRSALKAVGDLADRRRAREHRNGVDLMPVSSSFIRGLGYDETSGTMIVGMDGERVYGYPVPERVFTAVSQAHSIGSAYNNLVKGGDRSEVQRCEMCGRYTNGDHECPVSHHGPRNDMEATQNAMNRRDGAFVAMLGAQPRQPAKSAKSSTAGPNTPPPQPPPRVHSYDLAARLKTAGRQPLRYVSPKSLYGARGWTTDLADDIQPFVGSDHVPTAYGDDGGSIDGGVVRFANADANVARALATKVPPRGRDDRHGAAPSLSAMVAAAQSDDRIRFGGYLIGPDRTDERVSVYEVTVEADDADQAKAMIAGIDPAAGAPDEVSPVSIPGRPGVTAWNAWWD